MDQQLIFNIFLYVIICHGNSNLSGCFITKLRHLLLSIQKLFSSRYNLVSVEDQSST